MSIKKNPDRLQVQGPVLIVCVMIMFSVVQGPSL